MRVLVTGASGYIGSHVCKLLKEHGHEVHGFDNFFHGEYNDVSFIDKFWKQTITDNYLYGWGDAVVHLAGRSIVPQSLKEPAEYYRINTMGTKNVVEKLRTDNFIFASTSSAIHMRSPYARSKVAAEDIIREKSDGYTIFRFYNVSGTNGIFRQLGDASHLIRRCAMVAAGKLPHIDIFGIDYDTRDGTCIRDYIHVNDVANSILNAVENGPLVHEVQALGSNHGYSVLEVISVMEKVSGKKLKTKICDRRHGDGDIQVVDTLSEYCKLTKTLEDMCLDQYKMELKSA